MKKSAENCARGRDDTRITFRRLYVTHGWLGKRMWESEKKERTKHLEGLPDGLLVEHWVVRVAVLDALVVLVFGPERIAGALENL